jgi:hypothetical protein
MAPALRYYFRESYSEYPIATLAIARVYALIVEYILRVQYVIFDSACDSTRLATRRSHCHH